MSMRPGPLPGERSVEHKVISTVVMYEDNNLSASDERRTPAGLIIAGVLLVLCGGGAFIWASSNMDAIHPGAGQLALGFAGLLDPEWAAHLQQQAQLYQAAYYGGIIAVVIGGLLYLSGSVQRSSNSAG
ncbi:MAG: hypothetical protein LC772_12315 [Chloroflexi bacterium]|nr:hypothetical protein [Chloroflexota bacterium]